MTDRPFEQEPIEMLRVRWQEATAHAEVAKFQLKKIGDELASRYGDRFKAQLHNQGRDYGSQTVEQDGAKLKMAIEKSVTWDQDKLRALLMELPWDVAKELIDMKLSVGERVYNRITDDNLKGRITGARTVATKPVSIAFAE